MSKGQCKFHKCEDYMTLTSTKGRLHERNMYVHVYVCHDYVDYLVIDQLHILAYM